MKSMTNADTKVNKKQSSNSGILKITVIGMLSAIAVVLMLFDIPLWFAPNFYEIDFSEVPILVGAFALGPVAGVTAELVKILLNFAFTGSFTAGIGELANFLIGCALVVPSAIVYQRKKSKRSALLGMVIGTITMVIIGCLLNAFVLLPTYAKVMSMDKIIEAGAAVNPAINNLSTFVLFAVAPFNLLKGALVTVITMLIYKYISPVIKKIIK